ncbi:hypothetical protein DDZ13_02340 [Coraliomargarita sinensis]|uniref:Uncharacterized protein n=1 Tax=Coraliomargarita sinensis TaxID=2174842 RepID=A0A317ZPE2_9BACT|nr:hypothetical protein [Coraliomargarita sinensis]PXA05729.1 hypothetical protein DDZ13_02340 [Coraliomargarita sinensis]
MKVPKEIENLYEGALKGLIEPLKREVDQLKLEKQHSDPGLEARVINLELIVESMKSLKQEVESVISILSESNSPPSKKDFFLVVDHRTKKHWQIPSGSCDFCEYDHEKCLLVFTTETALIEVKLTFDNPSFEKVSREYQERWFAIIEAIKSSRPTELGNLFKTKGLQAEVNKTTFSDLLS